MNKGVHFEIESVELLQIIYLYKILDKRCKLLLFFFVGCFSNVNPDSSAIFEYFN